MAFYDSIRRTIQQLLTHPGQQAARWRRTLYFAVNLVRFCWRQLWEDRALEMAAALTYRTIFGLVPFLVIALIVFRAFGGFQEVGQEIQQNIYDYLGLSPIAIQQQQEEQEAEQDQIFATEADPQTQTAPSSPEAVTEEKEVLRIELESVLQQLNEQVEQVEFASIGAVGLVLLIWAALALAVTVEDCFNRVYRTNRGRSWHMRITIYWAVITLGPVLLMLSFWFTGQVAEWAHGIEFLGLVSGLLRILSYAAAFLATWLLLFLLYVLMPNASVRLRPAIIGAFVGAALWELAKWGFQFYVANAVGYSALYGSLGLIPLFLFWLYLTWLIVLFGLELTYVLQTMRGRRLELEHQNDDREIFIDPQWLIPVMAMIAEAFQQGKTLEAGDVATRTSLPLRATARLCEHLEREGLLHCVQTADGNASQYSLALPPDQIPVNQLLEIGHALSMNEKAVQQVPGREVLARLNTAQREATANVTLANVLQG